MTAAIIALVIAQIADIYTTVRVLERGGYEANGFLRQFGKSWPVAKLTLAGIAVVYAWQVGLVWPLWVGAAVIGVVAWLNWRQVK